MGPGLSAGYILVYLLNGLTDLVECFPHENQESLPYEVFAFSTGPNLGMIFFNWEFSDRC